MPGFSGAGPPMPIDQRSAAGLVGLFIVGPILAGGILLTLSVGYTVRHGDEYPFQDWLFQFAWGVCIGLGLLLALPATAVRELRRRKQARAGSKPS